MMSAFFRRSQMASFVAMIVCAFLFPTSLGAQQLSAPLKEGDVAISGFSGTKLSTSSLPAGVDPIERTVIDPEGTTLRIIDLSTLGGPTVGQIVNAPTKLAIPARDIGQVFGLVYDDGQGPNGPGAPNLYVAATSLFGLQIVGDPGPDGAPTRLKLGSPRAQFMPGQFGSLPGASPGSIWKIDGTTGAVSQLADTAFSGVANSGPGVGDLAFDPKSRSLYASDLDTGLIHRFDLARNAANQGQFDHGISGRPGGGLPSLADDGRLANILSPDFNAEDPETWGFTQPERRVSALAVHDGRLYYSVAAGPEIWSVAISPDGSLAVPARRELVVNAAQPFAVTDIAFDAGGSMILAQRGKLISPADYGRFTESGGQVLRYVPAAAGGVNADFWTPDAAEYPIGLPEGSRMGAGGVALTRNYNPDGTFGQSCQQTLISTGDDLRNNPALAGQLPSGSTTLHGIQINDLSLVRPINVPPAQSAFAAFDLSRVDPDVRGQVGDVEAVPCLAGGESEQAALPAQPDLIPTIGDLAGAPSGAAPFDPSGGGIDPNGPFGGGGGVLRPSPGQGGGGGKTPDPAGGGGGKTPSKVNGLEISKVKDPASGACTDQGDCKFSVTVKNTNATPVNGPIVINETVSDQNGALVGATAVTSGPTPPWTCGKTGQTFTCTSPGPIPAGATSTFIIGFKLGAGAAAQQIKNCALLNGGTVPACVSVPLAPPTPQQLLQVKKKANATQCSDAGGGCDFTISITNPGPAEFNGMFELNDAVTADGKSVPGAVFEGGQAIQQPGVIMPLSCKKGGEGLVCNTGIVQSKIPAGKTIDIPVSVKLGPGTNAREIKNCASIKDGSGEACATIPLKSGPLLRARKVGGGSTCIPKCTFAVQIQNIGNAPATGPFTMSDTFQPGGDVASIEVMDGDFSCAATQGKFVCISTKKELKPGELVSGRVTFRNVPEAPEYKNCLDITENPGIPVEKDAATRCATVKNTAPKQPNLAIKKTAPNAAVAGGEGNCSINSMCRFTIEIKSNGSAPWVGPIRIDDVITNGKAQVIREGPASSPQGLWTCNVMQNGSSTTCTSKSLTMSPGTSIRLEVAVTAGSTWKKNDRINNCARLVLGPGQAETDFTDNESCITAKLDPFNVKVAKTGDQACQPGGECNFTITLFNPGPIDHNAPVTISDKLNIGSAPITSISPALPCATQPTQIPFSCTSPGDVSLPLGGKPQVFNMTVKMPEGDAAAQFTNCATVAPTDAAAAAPALRATGGAADASGSNTACHTVTKANPPSAGGPNTIQPPQNTPTPTPVADKACFANMVADADGRCVCPPGTQWGGRSCLPFSGGMNPSQSPALSCPVGTVGTYPNCRLRGGGADPVQPQRPVIQCPRGTSGVYPDCRPMGGGPNTGQTQQSCPVGTRPLVVRGSLVRCVQTLPQEQPTCPAGTTGQYPRCAPVGSGGSNGNKPGETTTRPQECPAGTIGRYPRCRPVANAKPAETTPPPRTCPIGTFGRYPRCRSTGVGSGGSNGNKPAETTRPRECPAGTFGRYPRCRSPSSAPTRPSSKPTCPSGLKGPRCDQIIVR